jgi:sugar phosphate isomerase/epimerase
MKFAFSTVSCPKWDFETIVSRAREYGYDGVEIRGFLNESLLTSANVFVTDPNKVHDVFERGGVNIACLASSIAMDQGGAAWKFWRGTDNDRKSTELRTFIDTAHRLGCPLVKIFDTQVRPGQSRDSAGVALGDWLLPLADYAAERDVVILIENALSFRSAKEMWSILDRLQHPSIACCWDVFNAALVGESPYFSVPVLNSKIAYTQVKDAKLGTLGATYCKLGEGDVPVEKFVTRLMGVGYNGYITMEWEKAWLPGLAEPEEILPDAIQKLRKWAASEGADIPGVESDSEPAAATAGSVVN